MVIQCLLCVLIGYLVGTFNPSYILGLIKGVDIRKIGSGNAGASNALLNFGKLAGVLCALTDIGKTCLAIFVCRHLFAEVESSAVLCGVACILGHIFPFYMHFKGGKGLACYGGMLIMYNWKLFFVFLFLELVIALITDYICFVPMTASVIFPIVYIVISEDIIGALMLFAIAVIILIKHTENIKRILSGTEVRISYLWRKEKELERIKKK